MNERKPPFDKLAVRQAVNYAIDRTALVKIFGGQGTPTENILPPGLRQRPTRRTTSTRTTSPRPSSWSRQSGDAGMHGGRVGPHHRPDARRPSQYLAGVLNSIGFKTSVKTLDESVYWDTIATQKGDPQIAFQDWNQDYPEGQDFIDILLNGEHIVNVGNNNHVEHQHPGLQQA